MKKKILSLILIAVMLFSATALPVSAVDFERANEPFTKVLALFVDKLMTGLAGVLDAVMKENSKFVYTL